MKKLLFLTLSTLVLLSAASHAQVSFYTSQKLGKETSTKVMATGTLPLQRSTSYFLISQDFYSVNADGTYLQVFHEINFNTIPLAVHIEFRSTDFRYNNFYLGLSYMFSTKNGIIMVEPLYLNSGINLKKGNKFWNWNSSYFNLSVVTNHNWEWVNIQSFTDTWMRKKEFNFYTEQWIYFPVTDHLEVGVINTVSCIEKSWNWMVYPGIKIRFYE